VQLENGFKLGPYQILSSLGAGGMGEVYRAHDSRLMRDVAIKILPRDVAQDAERLVRFEQEARAAGALSHPNILAVYDFGVYEHLAYLVEELLEGETLRNLIRRDRVSARDAVQYGVQISSGLAAAHDKSITHRDLKPENIFLTRDGIVKILDFGLAKLEDPAPQQMVSQLPTTPKTDPGMLIGTVAYMSPEQLRGQTADARSDIFSFGVVLYELLAGERPFQGQASAELMSSILRDEADYREITHKVPSELLRVLSHCLEKNPSNRFQSARDLTFALRMIEANLFLQSERGISKPESTGQSIAVLPFMDMSPLKDHEYFCDGLAEELITALTKLPGLRVASRTSAFQYKNHQADIREIGRQLNVGTVLDGSVRKAGDRIRITAELINTDDGYHLWTEKYDRNLEDVFSIQDEIARTIVETLQLKLVGPSEQILVRRYTDNTEAYNLYLKGRHYWRFRTKSGLDRSIECFESAIAKDSSYALAYAGLGDTYSIMGFYGFTDPAKAYKLAMHAAEKSLELDPMLPEGHLSYGAALLYFDLNWERGEKSVRRSLELNPQFGMGYCWYSGFLTAAGRHQEGGDAIRKALELDPLSPLYSSFAGFHYYGMRRYDQALHELNKSLEIDPQFLLAHWYSGLCFMKKGLQDRAIDSFKRCAEISQDSTFFTSYLAVAIALSGDRERAYEIIREMEERTKTEYVAPLHFARVYLGLNDIDRVFVELEKAYEQRNVLMYLIDAPEFDSIRSDPRYQALLAKLER
jgi:eukaryotic-like serine/threonine-protein kinase